MDQVAIGARIKAARERVHLTQEKPEEIVDISPTHMSVIERGEKTLKLDTFDASPMHWAYLQMHFCRTVLTMPMKASRLPFIY